MRRLSQLIRPTHVDTFFAEYWRKRAHYSRGDRARSSTWMSPARFAEALRAAPFGDSGILLLRSRESKPEVRRRLEEARAGWIEAPSLEQICSTLAGEATLLINGMERRDAGCRALCLRLFQELNRYTIVNGYLSDDGSASGFGAHYDVQDVFILQITGTKRWALSAMLPSEPIHSPSPEEMRDYVMDPVETYDLTPGDVLYVPRGTWHDPRTVEGPSLHLTVTMPAWTPLDVLTWIGDQVQDDPAMRQEFHMERDPRKAAAAMKRQIEVALERIAQVCHSPDATARYPRDVFVRRAAKYAEDPTLE